MWWLKKTSFADQIRRLTSAGILDESTFWQIVRAERERADRSGVSVTVAVFTVKHDAAAAGAIPGWNAGELCRCLRSTARLTDHVGIAGENQLGVILWGTREVGAYRFVNRLGDKPQQIVSDCKLYVYPEVVDTTSRDENTSRKFESPQSNRGPQILERIAEVEQRLAEAMEIETPVDRDEDVCCEDESLSFGFAEFEPWTPQSDDFSNVSTATLEAPARIAREAPVRVESREAQIRRRPLMAESTPKIPVTIEPMENLFRCPHPLWKRCLDVVGAGIGLVVLSPVLLGIAALIRLTSPGPALFRQTREGHGGRLFTIYKFRTMRVGADAEKAELKAQSEQDGPAFKMERDPRITAIGSFLRKTCLDELPQLWNVLVGDMTLVGPRPLDYRESDRIARWGRRRLNVMPGLTCIWQVHGKSKVSFNEWMRMDIRYSQHVSLWQDLKLIFATLQQVVLRRASH